jgi:PAS domain S-box-containing protein
MKKNHTVQVTDVTHPDPQHNMTIQSRLTAILESSDDAIIAKDLQGIVTDWNKGAEIIFGYTASETVGNSITRLIPADRQDEEILILDKIRRGEKVDKHETVRQTKDGRLIHLSVSVTPIKDANGIIIGASKIARDITKQKTDENELSRMVRLYAALGQINQSIVRSTTSEQLFEMTCKILVDYGRFHMAWIGWHDPETHRILPVAAAGKDIDYLSTIEIYGDNRPEGRGPGGQAFRSGRPYICNDILHDPATLPWRTQLMQCNFQASAVFPICVKNRVCGTLTVYSDESFFFQDQEIALLTETAEDISFALDNYLNNSELNLIEEIANNERLFSNTMIESMPGILYCLDAEGRFLRWNHNFETVSGYSTNEIQQMHPLDFFLGQDKEHIKQRIAEVFEKGESFAEASFIAKDGTSKPFFFTGRYILLNGKDCLVGVGIDISQRKHAEQKRQEAQDQLAAVIENLREGLVIADPDGEFALWNPASLRLLGFSDIDEDYKNRHEFANILELYTPEGIPLKPSQWPLARILEGEKIEDLEIQVRRIGSDWERIFSFSGSLAHYGNENKLAFMTLHDITERKRIELALRVSNQTLETEVAARTSDLQAALVSAKAADRLKSAFLATMSHELRTPLNSIIGFTSIILQGLAGSLNTEQNKQLSIVHNSSHHLLELINDVLDLSKIEAGQLEVHSAPFNLRESIKTTIATVTPMADKKNLELSVIVSGDLDEMVSDRRRVEQVLLNLMNNAIKFTERGRIVLEAEKISTYQPSADISAELAVCIRVTDTGIGIHTEDLPLLFQPFRQLDAGVTRQHEGTGLGLAICSRIAALLGGNIYVESKWGKGSTFTITLPLQKPESL